MASDLQSRPKLASRVRLQNDPVSGEPVLLYPEGLLKLNPTAHEVLTRCNGETTIEEMIAALAAEYEVTADMLGSDVVDCLEQLAARQLITFAA